MTRAHVDGIINAILEALVVAQLGAFDQALEGADIAPDQRAALRAEEYAAVVTWYREQLARFQTVLDSFDSTIH